MTLAFRGLEMHGRRMWDRARVVQALDFCAAHGMNALVLHESDLVHQIVYPRACFDPYALWKDVPSRRGENAIFNNRAYFAHVLELAGARGIAVWINVKEIGFSDEVLELKPHLVKDGAVCPSEPWWMEYVAAKTDELFGDFPALAGMIVSMGSQESRASPVQRKCRCELCRRDTLSQWYGRLILALHAPARRHGKRLAIRDFAYRPADHAPLIEAMGRAPDDAIFSIKAMPHDFYLTFPDNPAIGALKREQWIEYDAMGQFFGWGVLPCFAFDDLKARLARWRARGAAGAIFRTEWERINDLSCFDGLNETNLIAAAALAGGEEIGPAEICRRWLAARGFPDAAAPWLAALLAGTWPVVRRAAYMNGHVFADNSMFPRSIGRCWWGMEVRDSLAAWDPARAADLALDRAKLDALLAEKDEAVALAKALIARVEAGDPALGPALHRWLKRAFAHYDTWAEGLLLSARVCLYARWAEDGKANRGDLAQLRAAIEALEEFGAGIGALAADPGTPHQRAMLIDPRRAADVAREGRAVLARATSSGSR